MNIEKELEAALQRQTAPSTLRAGIMSQVWEREARRRRMLWMRVAATAAFVVLLGGATTTFVSEQRERVRAAAAKEELMTAMKITSEKTNIARRAVLDDDVR